MHYLEDYLEIIEYLPAELKSRLTQIRELDGQVQRQLDSLNERTKTFFTLCRKNNKPELMEQQYQILCQEYEKVLKDSDEKQLISSQLHDLLERHLRRVDQDLSRFTMELEADTAGITEILEQRSYQLDRPPTPEKPITSQKQRHRHSILLHDDLLNGDFDDYSPSTSTRASPAPMGRLKYSRRDKDRLPILQLPPPDVDTDVLDLEENFTPSSLYAGTGGKPPLSFAMSDPKPPRKRNSIVNQPSPLFSEPVLPEPNEWMVDPNEPRYCLCNQVSYGEMVGCDNPECTKEWFHYGCVGITEPPKGKWYCPECSVSMKKRGSRKSQY